MHWIFASIQNSDFVRQPFIFDLSCGRIMNDIVNFLMKQQGYPNSIKDLYMIYKMCCLQ